MNVIFGTIIIISVITLIIKDPDAVLSAMLCGGENALNLSMKLVVIYAVWLGIFEVLDKTKLTDKISKVLYKPNKLLFGELPKKANDYMSVNIISNVFGMSGATTPFGIKSILELEKHKNTEYAIAMFFVINATSIQFISTSVIALRISYNSIAPTNVILPTILATAVSTITGILLVKIFIKKEKYV